MKIKFRTYIWNKNGGKILQQTQDELTEEELCELIQSKYRTGEYGIPMRLSKDEVVFETTIDGINI